MDAYWKRVGLDVDAFLEEAREEAKRRIDYG